MIIARLSELLRDFWETFWEHVGKALEHWGGQDALGGTFSGLGSLLIVATKIKEDLDLVIIYPLWGGEKDHL